MFPTASSLPKIKMQVASMFLWWVGKLPSRLWVFSCHRSYDVGAPFKWKHSGGVCGTEKRCRHQLMKGASPASPLPWPSLPMCPFLTSIFDTLNLTKNSSVYSLISLVIQLSISIAAKDILLHSSCFCYFSFWKNCQYLTLCFMPVFSLKWLNW